jgi:hypothetical protein
LNDDQPQYPSQRKDSTGSIRADLSGDDCCSALGVEGHGATPVLHLCRKLLAAGCDPATALHVYRDQTLALTFASISDAARLTVKTAGNGAPTFAPDVAAGGAGASPVSGGAVQ